MTRIFIRWVAQLPLIAGLVCTTMKTAEAEDITDGKVYFMRYCASCHGLTKEGGNYGNA